MEVMLDLPENVYRNLVSLANRTSRQISDVIVEKIQSDYWIKDEDFERNIAKLSDAEVLELANLKLSGQQDRRLSKLLEDQRESRLTVSENIELEGLMELYRKGNLRKAQSCLEAVRRGLISTPADLK